MPTKFDLVKIVKSVAGGALLVLAALLFYKYFLSPKLVYEKNFANDSKTITDLFPDGRTNDPEKNLYSGEKYQRISSEPVYFNAAMPKFFDKQMFRRVKITLTYQNRYHPLVELGLRKNYENLDVWSYEMKPIQNKLIDEFDGIKTKSNDTLILSNSGKAIEKPSDFLQNPPVDARVATYYANIAPHVNINNTITEKFSRFIYALQGSHNFVFYKGTEAANLNFTISDNSTNPSPQIIIRDAAKNEVARETWQNARITKDKARQFSFNIGGKPGIYFIELQASEAATISEITTSERYFVVQNQLTFGQTATPFSIYGDAAELQFLPKNNDGMQVIKIDKKSLAVYDLLERSIWPEKDYADAGAVKQISLSRGDVLVFGDGFFAFDKESYFNPYAQVFSVKHYMADDDFDYLVATNYESPTRSKRFYYASATFDLTNIAGKTNDLEFILSVPGLYKNKGDITIYKIQAEFERKPISPSKIKKLF